MQSHAQRPCLGRAHARHAAPRAPAEAARASRARPASRLRRRVAELVRADAPVEDAMVNDDAHAHAPASSAAQLEQLLQQAQPAAAAAAASVEQPAPAAAAAAAPAPPAAAAAAASSALAAKAAARREQRARQQLVYQVSAIAASTGITALTVAAVFYKFSYQVPDGAPLPWFDMLGTLALVFGGAVGMEMWARWAHRALWHDFAPGWALHKSHHEPRTGPFEANDLYAIINAVPAVALCAWGFFTPTLAGSLAFGAGLGITTFGIGYMFIHDGLVHRRFPVGPIAELPYLKRVVVAHRLHHSERYGGVPWGMFLGPQELEAVGAGAELDRLVAELDVGAARRST